MSQNKDTPLPRRTLCDQIGLSVIHSVCHSMCRITAKWSVNFTETWCYNAAYWL